VNGIVYMCVCRNTHMHYVGLTDLHTHIHIHIHINAHTHAYITIITLITLITLLTLITLITLINPNNPNNPHNHNNPNNPNNSNNPNNPNNHNNLNNPTTHIMSCYQLGSIELVCKRMTKTAQNKRTRFDPTRRSDLKRSEIWSVSWRMKATDPKCTYKDVYAALRKTDPKYWTQGDHPTVKRWSFAPSFDNKNRGTTIVSPKLRKLVLARNNDATVLDIEKTTRPMAAFFTQHGNPISYRSIRNIYHNAKLYPARETKELDLRQHHHRRLRIHFAKEHLHMTARNWENWVSTDETTISTQKPVNPKNNVKWVLRGTIRPNVVSTAKHMPSLNMWGAVGGKGQKSKLHIFKQNLTASYYKKTILTKYALPFYNIIKTTHPRAVFWQDNDPKHTPLENWVRANFQHFTAKPPIPCRKNIQRTGKPGRPRSDPCTRCRCSMPTYEFHPANSADLAIMENVWSLLQDKIWSGRKTSFTRIDLLQTAIMKAWNSITPAEIIKIQHSMPKRMKQVIEGKGWPIPA
jgi:hypothetical protein